MAGNPYLDYLRRALASDPVPVTEGQAQYATTTEDRVRKNARTRGNAPQVDLGNNAPLTPGEIAAIIASAHADMRHVSGGYGTRDPGIGGGMVMTPAPITFAAMRTANPYGAFGGTGVVRNPMEYRLEPFANGTVGNTIAGEAYGFQRALDNLGRVESSKSGGGAGSTRR